MKSNEKGITLAVLVITIIVLLILAGVSLNLAIGRQGGVLEEAINQTDEQNLTQKNIEKDMNSQMLIQEKEWGIE
jgi:hypothetical protein